MRLTLYSIVPVSETLTANKIHLFARTSNITTLNLQSYNYDNYLEFEKINCSETNTLLFESGNCSKFNRSLDTAILFNDNVRLGFIKLRYNITPSVSELMRIKINYEITDREIELEIINSVESNDLSRFGLDSADTELNYVFPKLINPSDQVCDFDLKGLRTCSNGLMNDNYLFNFKTIINSAILSKLSSLSLSSARILGTKYYNDNYPDFYWVGLSGSNFHYYISKYSGSSWTATKLGSIENNSIKWTSKTINTSSMTLIGMNTSYVITIDNDYLNYNIINKSSNISRKLDTKRYFIKFVDGEFIITDIINKVIYNKNLSKSIKGVVEGLDQSSTVIFDHLGDTYLLMRGVESNGNIIRGSLVLASPNKKITLDSNYSIDVTTFAKYQRASLVTRGLVVDPIKDSEKIYVSNITKGLVRYNCKYLANICKNSHKNGLGSLNLVPIKGALLTMNSSNVYYY